MCSLEYVDFIAWSLLTFSPHGSLFGGLSWALWQVWQHSWPLSTCYLEHSSGEPTHYFLTNTESLQILTNVPCGAESTPIENDWFHNMATIKTLTLKTDKLYNKAPLPDELNFSIGHVFLQNVLLMQNSPDTFDDITAMILIMVTATTNIHWADLSVTYRGICTHYFI